MEPTTTKQETHLSKKKEKVMNSHGVCCGGPKDDEEEVEDSLQQQHDIGMIGKQDNDDNNHTNANTHQTKKEQETVVVEPSTTTITTAVADAAATTTADTTSSTIPNSFSKKEPKNRARATADTTAAAAAVKTVSAPDIICTTTVENIDIVACGTNIAAGTTGAGTKTTTPDNGQQPVVVVPLPKTGLQNETKKAAGRSKPAETPGAVTVSANNNTVDDDDAPPTTLNPSNTQNQAVALPNIGLSKKSPKNRSTAHQAGAVAVSAAAAADDDGDDEGQLTASASTRQASTTTSNNGLSKKTPQARARAAAQAQAAAASSPVLVDNPIINVGASTSTSSDGGGGGVASGILRRLRGLAKNLPTSQQQRQQPQNNRPNTARGLRKNGHPTNRPGYRNQNQQNVLPPPNVAEGSADEEGQQNISPLVPAQDGGPTDAATSLSSAQLPDAQQAARNRPPHTTLRRGNTGLVVARAIQDDSPAVLMEAQEVDAEELERQKIGTKKRKECRMVGYVCIAVSFSIMAIVLGVKLGKKDEPSTSPTHFPSPAPSDSPSSSPSGALDLLMQSLPENTLESLDNYDTAQWKAREWLMNHRNISNLVEWRKKQLFALATFYYLFEGDNWNPLIQERWMDYEKDECQWFSSGFGFFLPGGEYFEMPHEHQSPSCNDDEEFTRLELQDLQLSGLAPSMPPEIALLTSLTAIALDGNYINASLYTMLPVELVQLANLTQVQFHLTTSELGLITSLTNLHLGSNALTGPIPSELGEITTLERLVLDDNDLSGQLPSELGLMTSLAKLNFADNSLTGPLPSELGLLTMTSLSSLYFSDNDLTGQLPSQLGFMTSLTELSLSGNALTGQLPSELGFLTRLTYLGLNDNALTGQLPIEICLMANMDTLYAGGNSLTGQLPSQLGLMNNTRWLYLDRNQFHSL